MKSRVLLILLVGLQGSCVRAGKGTAAGYAARRKPASWWAGNASWIGSSGAVPVELDHVMVFGARKAKADATIATLWPTDRRVLARISFLLEPGSSAESQFFSADLREAESALALLSLTRAEKAYVLIFSRVLRSMLAVEEMKALREDYLLTHEDSGDGMVENRALMDKIKTLIEKSYYDIAALGGAYKAAAYTFALYRICVCSGCEMDCDVRSCVDVITKILGDDQLTLVKQVAAVIGERLVSYWQGRV